MPNSLPTADRDIGTCRVPPGSSPFFVIDVIGYVLLLFLYSKSLFDMLSTEQSSITNNDKKSFPAFHYLYDHRRNNFCFKRCVNPK